MNLTFIRSFFNKTLFFYTNLLLLCVVSLSDSFLLQKSRYMYLFIIEPRCEKTGLRGFRPGLTQTGLYNHRRLLEA